MGKSWLLINMILQDMEERKGAFFIDPHGKAIDQLITHTGKRFMIYDFEDEERLLGINPLIGNNDDPAVRNEGFASTKALFNNFGKIHLKKSPGCN